MSSISYVNIVIVTVLWNTALKKKILIDVKIVSFQNQLFWSDKTTEFNNLIYILGNEAILSHQNPPFKAIKQHNSLIYNLFNRWSDFIALKTAILMQWSDCVDVTIGGLDSNFSHLWYLYLIRLHSEVKKLVTTIKAVLRALFYYLKWFVFFYVG
jgi:hypothetical protein